MAKKKTVVEETPKVEENVIEATEVNVDVDALSKSIESVDTTLPSNEEAIKEIEEKIQEELKPLQDLQSKVSEMLDGQEAFNDAIAQNPENAEAIINNELKKAEVLKSEVEKIIKTSAVIDRTSLILEIFAQRAKTSYAKMQVELARYNYMLPRLAGMWTHLERQRGGRGTRGGMGETQIEVDRRIVKERITRLKEQLRKVDRQMATQRGNRGNMVRLALVGYTNVGKSTIMNLLAKSDVFAENKLFATLDTTVRKVVIENVPFLLSDTVGFIRKLPTQLIEAFKSTLDEVREADILLHVVDICAPDFEEQMKIVEKTLSDIGASDKPVYVIFNKVDAYTHTPYDEFSLEPKAKENRTLDELKNSWIANEKSPCIFISAKNKVNIEKLRNDLYKMVAEIHAGRYPFNNFLW